MVKLLRHKGQRCMQSKHIKSFMNSLVRAEEHGFSMPSIQNLDAGFILETIPSVIGERNYPAYSCVMSAIETKKIIEQKWDIVPPCFIWICW